MEGGPDYRSQLDTRCDSGRAQSCQSRDSLREPMKRVLQIKFPHPLPELHALPLSAASTPKKVHKGQIHGVDSSVSSTSLSLTPTTSPQGPTSPLAVIRDGRISQSTSKTGWRRIRHWCVTSSRISKREEILAQNCVHVLIRNIPMSPHTLKVQIHIDCCCLNIRIVLIIFPVGFND